MTRRSAVSLFALALVLGASSPAAAQHVRIWYAAPTGDMLKAFGAANLSAGVADGYRQVMITDARVKTFKSMASENVKKTYDALQPGTALRKRVDRMLQISGGIVDVEIRLMDDATGIADPESANVSTDTDETSGITYSWPSATPSKLLDSGRWSSTITLGDYASTVKQKNSGAWLAWESTILHETFHTQMLGKDSRWPRLDFAYGGDGSHWTSELLGDQEVPWQEGVATYFGSTHNDPGGLKDLMDFFGQTDPRYLLESRSVLAGTAALWNAPHNEENLPVPARLPQVGSYSVRSYRWKDVPGNFVLYSESTATAFHLLFWKYANGDRDQAFDMIFNVAREVSRDRMHRFLAYSVLRLAQQLEELAATPAGQAAKSAGTLTSSLYPFALLDMLTRYGMDRASFETLIRAENQARLPRAYTEYWNHREALKKLVAGHLAASPTRVEDAAVAIHKYCQDGARIVTTDKP